MSDTLVLNRDGSPLSIVPLSIIPWQEAVKLIYLNKVSILTDYSDWIVHSQRASMPVPAIVMTKKYVDAASKVKFTKMNLMYRDNFTCQYCSKKFEPHELTMDHVIPKSFGGRKTWDNIVCACTECNWKRGHDVRIQPKIKPYKPSHFDLMAKRKLHPIYLKHESWNHFLQWDEKLLLKKPKGKSDNFKVDVTKF